VQTDRSGGTLRRSPRAGTAASRYDGSAGWPHLTDRFRWACGPRDGLRSGRSTLSSAIIPVVTGAEFAFYYSLMVTTGADLPDLTDVFQRPAWHAQAACRGVDVSVFVPAFGESTAPAKALCATCPVAEPCRAYALDRTDVQGVWDGTRQGQRSVLRGCAPGR
jgi:WhiB family redox-sensing transcriptional regulator